VGGFAKTIASIVSQHGPQIDPALELTAVCDPALDAHEDQVRQLKGDGVTAYDTYEQLLDHDGIEAVWLPLPIDLHRGFTERALAAGKAVMVEKPVAGSLQDVDAMIAARDEAGLPVAVGFHDIYARTTAALKRQLLDGEFGEVRRATVYACWPRGDVYFNRSTWAGKRQRNGVWVMDSPANNALAHYIALSLFLLGPEPDRSADAVEVAAELYRAGPIETFDTCSLKITLANGVELIVLFTHACTETLHPNIVIEGADGKTVGWTFDAVGDRLPRGCQQVVSHPRTRKDMVQRFAQLVRGIDNDQLAVASLEVGRAHTLVVNAASEATPVIDVPERAIEIVTGRGGTVSRVPGIEAAFSRCAAEGKSLHESGAYGFTQPAGVLDTRGYTRFAGPAAAADRVAAAAAAS